jgi:uncharacterized protein RhaS with RHS repeats
LDATLGVRFSRDPIDNAEMSEGPNLYAYVRNNPAVYIDEDGKFAQVAIGAGLGAASSVALQLLENGGLEDALNGDWDALWEKRKCIDLADVGISAAQGAMGFTLLKNLNNLNKARKGLSTINQLNGRLRNVESMAAQNYLRNNANKALRKAAGSAAGFGAAQALKSGVDCGCP